MDTTLGEDLPEEQWHAICDTANREILQSFAVNSKKHADLITLLQATKIENAEKLEKLKRANEEHVQLLKNKLGRKDELLLTYDEDLSKLSEYKTKTQKAELTVQSLEVEIKRLKTRIGDQSSDMLKLTETLDEQKSLSNALLSRKGVPSVSTPLIKTAPSSLLVRSPPHACVLKDNVTVKEIELKVY